MKNEPLISVIIPIYNTAKYLDACIESVLSQTYKNVRIILVDDESPDEAPAMCDRWAEREEKIEVIHKHNEGLGLTRNAGLDAATGDYVCFLDSDDTLDCETFEACMEALDNRNADACFYGRKTGKADGTYSVNTNIPEKLVYEGDEVRREWATTYLGPLPDDKGPGYIQVSACCAMYRRSIIEEHNIRFMSERKCLSEDTFFNLEVCRYAQKVIIIPKEFYNYTYNGESLTKKYNPNKFNQLKDFYRLLMTYKEAYAEADAVDIRIPYQLYVYLRHIIEYEVKSYKLQEIKNTYRRVNDICNDAFIRENIQTVNTDILSKKRKLLIDWIMKKRVILILVYYMVK